MNVSVVIPCRNEQENIGVVLRSLLAQTPAGVFQEVIVADGKSTDATAARVSAFASAFTALGIRLQLLENPGLTTPSGLNRAVRAATGDFIVRIDAHCQLEASYIQELVHGYLTEGADLVGPAIQYYGHTETARHIVAVLHHRLGNGGTASRNNQAQAVRVKHTVMSCYHRRVWETIGGYDESLFSNEDFDFDYRAAEHGFEVVSLPHPVYRAEARPDLRAFWQQRFRYGYWKYRVVEKHPRSLHLRQLIPVVFGVSCILGLGFPPLLILNGLLLLLLSIVVWWSDRSLTLSRLGAVLTVNYLGWAFGFLWSFVRRAAARLFRLAGSSRG